MVYNKEATPYGGVIFTDRGQYGAAHQEDPCNVQNMVSLRLWSSSTTIYCPDVFVESVRSDPSVDGSDTCSHYYVNSCELDQSPRDSQVSCVEACVTDRFAQTMKGVIDDVSVCAYPVSSTFYWRPTWSRAAWTRRTMLEAGCMTRTRTATRVLVDAWRRKAAGGRVGPRLRS